MKRLILILLLSVTGCLPLEDSPSPNVGEPPVVFETKKDDSTVCDYWKCSTTKQLYMQKYVRDVDGIYRSDGAFKLDEGVGAFPLNNIGNEQNETNITISIKENGFAHCPYCPNQSMGECHCKKKHCVPPSNSEGITVTCPWCGNTGTYTPTDDITGGSKGG